MTAAATAPTTGWDSFYAACATRDAKVPNASAQDIERLKSKGYSVVDCKIYSDECYGFQWHHAGTDDFSDEPHDTADIAWAVAMLHEQEQIKEAAQLPM